MIVFALAGDSTITSRRPSRPVSLVGDTFALLSRSCRGVVGPLRTETTLKAECDLTRVPLVKRTEATPPTAEPVRPHSNGNPRAVVPAGRPVVVGRGDGSELPGEWLTRVRHTPPVPLYRCALPRYRATSATVLPLYYRALTAATPPLPLLVGPPPRTVGAEAGPFGPGQIDTSRMIGLPTRGRGEDRRLWACRIPAAERAPASALGRSTPLNHPLEHSARTSGYNTPASSTAPQPVKAAPSRSQKTSLRAWRTPCTATSSGRAGW